MERVLRKAEQGEGLTEHEELIFYWYTSPGGCHACGGHHAKDGCEPVVGVVVQEGVGR